MTGAVRQLVSVHDVMPETLQRVASLLERVERAGLGPATLLVVPGRDWRHDDLATLRQFLDTGHELAGHGWHHDVQEFRNLAHRLHGLLLSRRAAEHLAHDTAGIETLIRRCRAWFDEQALPAPRLYVPPAWAMGPMPRRRLQGLGFRYYEYLTGYLDTELERFQRVPLAGFEADTPTRALALRLSNGANRLLARCHGQLRIALHPFDAELRLADDLARTLASEPRQESAR
ncbi:MAG: polysaccharide deacetylase family protein [Woeseiaceae bacterium]|nr:polysaccharide deacetylase family protein [Woeseiaceae bacterium]